MSAVAPSDDGLIYDLVESFGHLWEPEPPLYSNIMYEQMYARDDANRSKRYAFCGYRCEEWRSAVLIRDFESSLYFNIPIF